jgi:hypothetical protein
LEKTTGKALAYFNPGCGVAGAQDNRPYLGKDQEYFTMESLILAQDER